MANGHGGARAGAGRPRKVPAPINRETLTEDQIKLLKTSPYVAKISENQQVSYTLAFKEMFWQRYMDGVPPIEIFRDAGLSPDILGQHRIHGFAATLRKQKEEGVEFTEGNQWSKKSTSTPRFDIPKPPRLPPNTSGRYSDADITRLFHQVAYMTQELEFIKKLLLRGRRESRNDPNRLAGREVRHHPGDDQP